MQCRNHSPGRRDNKCLHFSHLNKCLPSTKFSMKIYATAIEVKIVLLRNSEKAPFLYCCVYWIGLAHIFHIVQKFAVLAKSTSRLQLKNWVNLIVRPPYFWVFMWQTFKSPVNVQMRRLHAGNNLFVIDTHVAHRYIWDLYVFF